MSQISHIMWNFDVLLLLYGCDVSFETGAPMETHAEVQVCLKSFYLGSAF